MFTGVGHSHAKAFADSVRGRRIERTSGAKLGDPAQHTDGNRGSKYSGVVVVDLVFEGGSAFLVESFELVKVDGISIGHDEAMEDDGKPRLAEGINFAGF